MKYKSNVVLKISAVLLGLLVVVIGFIVVSKGDNDYRVAKIFEVNGNVTVVKDGIEYRPYAGMNIQEGTVIVTSAGSDIRMLLDEDKYIKLESGSRMTFEKLNTLGSGNAAIKLERGNIVSEIVKPLKKDEQYIINTPNAILAVRGTFFRVGISRNEDGDTDTDVYTYSGTVASNRILPNGKIVEEDVLIKRGYKAKINMDDKNTIYVLDEVDGEKTQPINIDDISNEDLIDIYFASKNGHEMFIDMKEIEKNISLRNIDIEKYKSSYDKARKVIGWEGVSVPDDSRPLLKKDEEDDLLISTYGAPYDGTHMHKEVKTIVNATCTEDGCTTLTCETCGMIVQEQVLEATGHTSSEPVVEREATCTQTGIITTKCMNCDLIISEEIIPIQEHVQVINTIPSTCTENGKETIICSVCELVFSENELEATGHIESHGGDSEAHSICSMCGEILSTEHIYVEERTKEPTCIELGEITHSCECGYSYTTEIEVIEHTETKGGTKEAHSKCSMCGEILSTEHIYVEERTKEPTCTEVGEMTYSCECGYSYTTEIEVIAHTETKGGTKEAHSKCSVCGVALNTEHIYVKKQIKAPTCTTVGEMSKSCECGYSYITEIDLIDHTEVKGGTKNSHSECSVCGEILNDEHTYTVKQIKESTCTAEGEKEHSCDCGYTYTSEVPKTGHIAVKGGTEAVHSKCGTCGEVLSTIHTYSTSQTLAPTCTDLGEEHISCECGYAYDSEISAKGHIKATNNSVSECDGCGKKMVDLSSENFPDAAFLAHIKDEGYDIDNDGILFEDELGLVRNIDVSYNADIASLTGIEHFTSVVSIDCTGVESLVEIDTTGLTQLNSLDISKTGITEIICNSEKGNDSLQNLYANSCSSLTLIDVSGTNVNTLVAQESRAVTYIDISNAAFTSFDTSIYPELENIILAGTSVNSLDLTTNTKLTLVDANNCASLENANMSGLVHLTSININNCLSLKTLDISNTMYTDTTPFNGLLSLEEFYANGTYLMEIPLTLPCTTLKVLEMNDSIIQTADLSYCTSLKRVSLKNAELTEAILEYVPKIESMDISGSVNLKSLAISDSNVLSSFDITGCTGIEELGLVNLPMVASLDLTGFSNLKDLTLEGISISDIDTTDCDKLESISVVSCENITDMAILDKAYLTSIDLRCPNLTEINLSGCTGLTGSMRLPGSPVRMFNVSGCTGLDALELYYDQGLTSLDISNTNLTTLDISTHPDLSSLNLTGATKLTEINANGCLALFNPDLSGLTEIQTLDFRQCSAILSLDTFGLTKLENLYIDGCSNMTDLNISGCTMITSLSFDGCGSLSTFNANDCTGLTSLDISGRAILETLNINGCTGIKNLNLAGCSRLNNLQVQNCALACIDLSSVTTTLGLFISTTTHTVSVEEDGVTIDIATQFPATFDVTKVTWGEGITYDSATNTLRIDTSIDDTFTYIYDCGYSNSLNVTVKIN